MARKRLIHSKYRPSFIIKLKKILSLCTSNGAIHNFDLDPEIKIYNQEINKRRTGIEHVLGRLKTFKILAERYRNRGKRVGLTFNLIAGIYNLELSKK